MPYPNEHAARIIQPSKFQKNSFRRIKIKTGIDAIIGKLIGETKTTTQAYRFNKDKYTVEQAKKWLKDNKIKYISFEPASNSNAMNEKLLLFTSIFSYSAEAFVKSLNEIPEDEDVEIWMNSPGGSVFAGWSIIGALTQRSGKNNVKVFGDASSMAAYMLLFMDHVEAIDVSNFTIHRANGYVETDEEKAFLAKVNSDLRKKMEKKIDSKIFSEVTGYTFDDIFDPEKRINANLTAKQAKKIGLIDKIIRLEPNQIAAFKDRFIGFHSFDNEEIIEDSQGSEEKTEPKAEIKENVKQKQEKKMTKEEIKAQYPDVYKAIFDEGCEYERDWIEGVLEFVDVDAAKCKEVIRAGKPPTHKFFAEMARKGMSQEALKDSKDESIKDVKTETDEPKAKTDEEKALAKAEKEVFAAAGIKGEEDK